MIWHMCVGPGPEGHTVSVAVGWGNDDFVTKWCQLAKVPAYGPSASPFRRATLRGLHSVSVLDRGGVRDRTARVRRRVRRVLRRASRAAAQHGVPAVW